MCAKKILLKSDKKTIEKYGFDLWPKLSHNVTTLDNDDIDISMSHILLFPKIYNLAVCQLLRQISKNRYPATLLITWRPSSVCKLFQKSSPLKPLGQFKPNLAWIILRGVPLKFMADDPADQPSWPPCL
jgi:hypothetical protein